MSTAPLQLTPDGLRVHVTREDGDDEDYSGDQDSSHAEVTAFDTQSGKGSLREELVKFAGRRAPYALSRLVSRPAQGAPPV